MESKKHGDTAKRLPTFIFSHKFFAFNYSFRCIREPDNKNSEQSPRQHRQKRAAAERTGQKRAHRIGVEASVHCIGPAPAGRIFAHHHHQHHDDIMQESCQ